MSSNNQDPPVVVSGGNSMTVGNQDPPIIISGGSVTIEFKSTIFTKEGENKYGNPDKRIESVVIELDGEAPQTFEIPDGKVTVTINYANNKT